MMQDVLRTKCKKQIQIRQAKQSEVVCRLRWNRTIASWLPTPPRYFAIEVNKHTSMCLLALIYFKQQKKKNMYSKLQCSVKAARSTDSGSDDDNPTNLERP